MNLSMIKAKIAIDSLSVTTNDWHFVSSFTGQASDGHSLGNTYVPNCEIMILSICYLTFVMQNLFWGGYWAKCSHKFRRGF
jgi:hypothetical protein